MMTGDAPAAKRHALTALSLAGASVVLLVSGFSIASVSETRSVTVVIRALLDGSLLAAVAVTYPVWRARSAPGTHRLWVWSALCALVLVGSVAYFASLPDGPVIPIIGTLFLLVSYVGQCVVAVALGARAR